jgi:hypothetical protein
MDETSIDETLERFLVSIESQRSLGHCLRLWSRFVRARDDRRCVLCGSATRLAAHHIIRRSFIPMMQLETGNGITLCVGCHREPHAAFNGRPDLLFPMDAQGGDNVDVVAVLFHALAVDGRQRGQLDDTYYYISDSALRTFKNFQCIDPDLQFPGYRVEQAHLIWRQTSRAVMRWLLRLTGYVLPEGLIQYGGVTILSRDAAREPRTETESQSGAAWFSFGPHAAFPPAR